MRYSRWLGIAAALAAQAALVTLMTGTALAGGWAEVTMVDGSEDPPIAGEVREIRFSLLQHGGAAVDFGEAQLTAVNSDTGESITVAATNHGGGMWSALVTFPQDGNWQITIAHDGLETTEPATLMAVGQLDGFAWLPGALALTAFGLMAVAVLGSMLLIGRRRHSTAEPTATPLGAS
jgi:hypothetical protein